MIDNQEPNRWADLDPEPGIVRALEHAGDRNESDDQNGKRHWSENFANACAVAIADQFRKSDLRKKRILPDSLESGTEPLTPLGSGTSKRIDVTVTDPILGLEVGASLKGLNFRDGKSRYFDKNITGRLYELGDEVRLVHEHLPHAFMIGIVFMPLASVADKTERSSSSFANAVVKLRERTGRLDAALAGQSSRCDMGYVALYTTGEEGYPSGIIRFLNVENPPPRRGRPRVEDTFSLREAIDEAVARATYTKSITWAEPEGDDN
ncbi:hypothetical protein [Salinicola endophyticus]|uniref:Restriction endonuclease n=1 Tax=Salinicola endophyticus TaxID=1949083 RepID=A0AB74UEC2_9GAMM